MTATETKEVIRRLGLGEPPESLSLRRTREGLVDLRGIALGQPPSPGRFRTPGGAFDYAPEKPVFEHLTLDQIDLSGSSLENSYWLDCTFRRVRLDRMRGRGTNFASSRLDSVSFFRADLRNANWGLDRLDGPVISEVHFVGTDMRGTSYGHPLFRNCRFERCNLKQVNFRGSRFEDCVFVGSLDEVIFCGWDRDPEPSVEKIRNPMKNINFSAAELRNVAFSNGIDLSSCAFPANGYVRIPHPRRTFRHALTVIAATWSGPSKEQAETFLDGMLKTHFVEEQPFDVARVRDFEEPPWEPNTGKALLQVLLDASQAE
jgi:uncharacterized protein YjbI with pentapeptide repeats